MKQKYPVYRVGIGQDSHRFMKDRSKPFIFGGIVFEDIEGLEADSDGDVLLHCICNAITSLAGTPILGGIAIDLCKKGVTDSKAYLQEALKALDAKNQKMVHLAVSIEGQKPKFQPKIEEIKENLARLMDLNVCQIGITATSGDFLSDFGRGLGISCFCTLTTVEF